MPRLCRSINGVLAGAVLFAAMPSFAQETAPVEERPQLALMGTIPIFWGEADGFRELLDSAEHAHWARAAIEREYALVPLDFLTAEALAPHSYLLLAQPRALAAEENVALDAWVRGGGRVLIFADPMMTGESRFAIGDRRRPMDVTLLSPILAHWGIEMQYDFEQEEGLRWTPYVGGELPVNLPGEVTFLPASECMGGEGAPIARCEIGEGRALILADAAILDFAGPYRGAPQALDALFSAIFAENGDEAGNGPADGPNLAENGAKPPVSPAAPALVSANGPP